MSRRTHDLAHIRPHAGNIKRHSQYRQQRRRTRGIRAQAHEDASPWQRAVPNSVLVHVPRQQQEPTDEVHEIQREEGVRRRRGAVCRGARGETKQGFAPNPSA
ncbi:hypothetical protein B0H13DRAFT_2300049 [Mycena leptocephala]|nr:hypothetical protein B0H13DRAFT_2300049 [Mycena leptocephala]